jgi:hypothetical protein
MGRLSPANADATICKTVDLTAGAAFELGVPSLSPSQFLDLTLLHEIAHSFGVSHRGTEVGNTVAFYNTAIWQACFK